MHNILAQNSAHCMSQKSKDKRQESFKRYVHFNLKTYDREKLLKILYSSLDLCAEKTETGVPTHESQNSTDKLITLSNECEIIVDIWESHGLQCCQNNKQCNKIGCIKFPVCNVNTDNLQSADSRTQPNLSEMEPGIIIHKSLKSMSLNNPELFGMTPKEKHTVVSLIPLIGCHSNTCHLSKFSLVESQNCKLKEGGKSQTISEVNFGNSTESFGDNVVTEKVKKKKRKKIFDCFKRKTTN